MTRSGLRAWMAATLLICQQSPNLGRWETGATAGHHLLTPTRDFLAPTEQRREVALGARETMRGEMRGEMRVNGIRENSSRERWEIAGRAFGLVAVPALRGSGQGGSRRYHASWSNDKSLMSR